MRQRKIQKTVPDASKATALFSFFYRFPPVLHGIRIIYASSAEAVTNLFIHKVLAWGGITGFSAIAIEYFVQFMLILILAVWIIEAVIDAGRHIKKVWTGE